MKLLKSNVVFASVVALSVAVAGCTKNGSSNLQEAASGQQMDKAAWLEKVVSALRNGEPLGGADDVDAMLSMSEEQVVDKLLSDPRFGDATLSFNLFFLGRSVNKLKTKNGTGAYSYNESIFSSPQALASAKAVVEGGDYFEIFSKDPALITPGLRAPLDENNTGMSGEDLRKQIKDDTNKILEKAILAFQPANPGEPLNKQAGCDQLSNLTYELQKRLTSFGLTYELTGKIIEKWMTPITGYYPPGACENDQVSAQEVETKAKAVKASLSSMLADLIASPNDVKVKSIKDFVTLSYDAPEGAGELSEPFTQEGFWNNLKNSSTNYNRKRAAYVLKTYFCDDLTPINVEIPTSHAGNAHASDPACVACHYKLDPMGGLFRYNGQNGTNYEKSENFVFDDFKSIYNQEFEDYLNSWKNDQGKWKVGYYVGVNKPHSKWKGDKLEDLWDFFKQSKEVKQCLVRRMAEYFMGPDQVYDAGWLDEISKDLKPGGDSAAQFKSVVKTLVTSNTFKQQDPVPGKCYDYDSDSASSSPEERAPCEIAYIVKKRCATCHTDAEDLGVDFTAWKKLENGEYGFVHLNDDRDAQLPKKESLKRILDRITSTDPSYRMPFGAPLSELEKQTLYKWLDKEINSGN